MALVLTVEHGSWWAHVSTLAERLGDTLVPVVKGNGYGLGRAELVRLVGELGLPEVAVGTVYELAPPSVGLRQLVLAPALENHLDGVPTNAILTVGSLDQVNAASGHGGPVALKLRSSMRRYGVAPEGFDELLAALPRRPHCTMLHLPLVGSDTDRLGEIEAWLPRLPVEVPCSVSHLSADSFEQLQARHPHRSFRLRLGTSLWHGEKSALHLGAIVTELRPVRAGDTAGYRLTPIPADGHLVVISAGTAHGVAPLPDGRSPFHFERTRLDLLENPHMHSAMAFVEAGAPCPRVGDVVDVQRPLTQVAPDRVLWLR